MVRRIGSALPSVSQRALRTSAEAHQVLVRFDVKTGKFCDLGFVPRADDTTRPGQTRRQRRGAEFGNKNIIYATRHDSVTSGRQNVSSQFQKRAIWDGLSLLKLDD
jgi:hypothetical protein